MVAARFMLYTQEAYATKLSSIMVLAGGVGGSPSDAQASNAAGLYFVASLQSGIRQRRDFANYRVDACIERFAKLADTVAHMEKS